MTNSPQIASTLSQFLSAPSTASEKVRKTVYELAENVITILWCLSWVLPIRSSIPLNICRETSNKALNAINEIHLVPFLMSFLSARGELPLPPVTAAGTTSLLHYFILISNPNQPSVFTFSLMTISLLSLNFDPTPAMSHAFYPWPRPRCPIHRTSRSTPKTRRHSKSSPPGSFATSPQSLHHRPCRS